MRASISPGQRPTGSSTCLLLKLLIPIGCSKRQNVIYLVLTELPTSQGSPLVLISLSTSLELLPASGPKPSVPQPPQVHEHSLVSDTLSAVFVSRMKPLHFIGHWGTSHGILVFQVAGIHHCLTKLSSHSHLSGMFSWIYQQQIIVNTVWPFIQIIFMISGKFQEYPAYFLICSLYLKKLKKKNKGS